jgi:hypothetical protein
VTHPLPSSEPAPNSLRTTIILTAIVAGLGLFVWLGGDIDSSADALHKGKRIFPFLTSADVTSLEVTTKAGAKLLLERAPLAEGAAAQPGDIGQWTMKAPVEDRADGGEAFRILNALEFLEARQKVEGEQAKQLSFGETEARVTITRKDLPAIAFELGAEHLGDRPLRVEGDPALYYVGAAIGKDLSAEPWTFREKTFFDDERAHLSKVTVRVAPAQAGPGVADREVTLVKHDHFWRVGDPTGEFVAEPLLDELVSDLYALPAKKVEVEAPTEADLARLGLAPAQATFVLSFQEKDEAPVVRTLDLGAPVPGVVDQRYARLAGRAPVFCVEVTSVTADLERPVAGWASDTLFPFRGASADLTGFGVKAESGEWGMTRRDRTWLLDGPKPVVASTAQVEAMLQDVLDLKIIERVEGADMAALGLDPPQLKLALVQEPLRREVHFGAPKEGAPGVHYARRVGEDRVFTVKVDTLPSRLEAGALELLEKKLFEVSDITVKRCVITDPDGKVTLDFGLTADGARNWQVTTPPHAQVVSEKLDRFLADALCHLPAEKWVAVDSPQARAEYGLDRPTRIALSVEAYEEGKKAERTHTLLVGRREGDRVFAVAEGGYAIGRADASFLDIAARGFGPGTKVFTADRYDARSIVVKQDGAVTLELVKRENWVRQPSGAIIESLEVQDLVMHLEEVEVQRAEAKTPERLAATGLDAPRLSITLRMEPAGKPPVTRTLLIGGSAGQGGVWATADDSDRIGVLYEFDAPLRPVREWLADHEDGSAFPPVDQGTPPQQQQQQQQACAVCGVALPPESPFSFRGRVACSMNHVEELKRLAEQERQ